MRHLNSRHLMVLILALFTLSASAGSAQPTDQGVVRPLTIELSSFKFTPATLQLQRGTTYRIHFVNVSSGGHNFVAREFFAASTIAATDQGKVHDGEINLARGVAANIVLVPNRVGSFKSHCSHFMHRAFGMTGTIEVQ
jgi:plastocyanin